VKQTLHQVPFFMICLARFFICILQIRIVLENKQTLQFMTILFWYISGGIFLFTTENSTNCVSEKQVQIKNGGMEVWSPSGALSNWQKVQNGGSVVEKESTSPHSGGYCVKLAIDEANSYAGIQQSFRLPLSVLCKLSLYYKTTGGATGKLK